MAVGLRDESRPSHVHPEQHYGDADTDVFTDLPAPPGEVQRLTAVEDLPRYMAIFLAALAASAISFGTTMDRPAATA